jgi:hypothetical protein
MSIKTILEKAGHKPQGGAPNNEGGEGGAADSGAAAGEPGDDNNSGAGGDPGDGGTQDPPAPPAPPAPPPPVINEDDITDDLVLKVLNKRKGTQFKSLDDLNKPAESHQPTEEEQRQSRIDRQNNIRAWALQNKKVTSTDFDEFAQESSVPYAELALDLYKAERLEVLKKSGVTDLPDDKELENEFNELNFQYAKPEDAKRVKAEQRMQREVEGYLQSKYQKIYDLDDEYGVHETSANLRTSYNNVVSQVFNEAATEFAELTFEIAGEKPGQKIPYKFKVSPELLNTVRNEYGSDGSFTVLGQGNVDAANLKGAVKNTLINKALNEIISEVANAHAAAVVAAQQKGRRNIPIKDEGGPEGKEVKRNPVIQKLLEKNKVLLNT